MAHKLVESKPLNLLRKHLGINSNLSTSGKAALGEYGAVIGYCQGLFNNGSSPDNHTLKVLKNLEIIQAPRYKSHELYWDYRKNEPATEFFDRAMSPLIGSGRVPILITNLDPAKDLETINEIVSTNPRVHYNQTILFRIILNNTESINPAIDLIRLLLQKAKISKEMPIWFPALQANFSADGWDLLKEGLGNDWKYVNIAVNPFTPIEVLDKFSEQITIVQFLVGANNSIDKDGNAQIHSKMCVTGKKVNLSYNVFVYAKTLANHEIHAKNIICGPSLNVWGEEYNRKRLSKYLSVFKQATALLWPNLTLRSREELLALQV